MLAPRPGDVVELPVELVAEPDGRAGRRAGPDPEDPVSGCRLRSKVSSGSALPAPADGANHHRSERFDHHALMPAVVTPPRTRHRLLPVRLVVRLVAVVAAVCAFSAYPVLVEPAGALCDAIPLDVQPRAARPGEMLTVSGRGYYVCNDAIVCDADKGCPPPEPPRPLAKVSISFIQGTRDSNPEDLGVEIANVPGPDFSVTARIPVNATPGPARISANGAAPVAITVLGNGLADTGGPHSPLLLFILASAALVAVVTTCRARSTCIGSE